MKLKLPEHVADEVATAGGEIVEFGRGGKHPFVKIKLAGQIRKFCFPSTPSDGRSMMNNRLQLRRLLRKIIAEAKPQAA